MQNSIEIIRANWSAPKQVIAVSTTRQGGVSQGGFYSWNLASHVHDEISSVKLNRQRLQQELGLKNDPAWLEQTHSTRVINLDQDQDRDGDAATTTQPGVVAVVLTADCLPVLFTNTTGTEVAAAHAGWRGLANGILEHTLQSMQSQPEQLMAWMGPAIGPNQFEVGAEVRDVFVNFSADAANCFIPNRPGHFLADLYELARLRLQLAGVGHVWGGEYCTYSQPERFFSYRREKITGRQASLIYIKQ